MPYQGQCHCKDCDGPAPLNDYTCPACGESWQQLNDAPTVCPHCGWEEGQPWTCKGCGRENHKDVTMCPGCYVKKSNLEATAICDVLSVIAKDGDKIIEAVRDMGKQERGEG